MVMRRKMDRRAFLAATAAVPVFPVLSTGAAAAPRGGIREAPLFCVVPLCLTALGCLALFFFADPIYMLLEPIAAP